MGRPAAALPVMIWTDAPGGETPRFHKNSLFMGTGVTVASNQAYTGTGSGGPAYGAGIAIANGTVTLSNASVQDNGSGVYIAGGMVTLSNASVQGNGSGVYIAGGMVTLSTDSIESNSGGGGISITGGTVTLSNDTVQSNSAFGGSGGISITGGTVTLCGDTVQANTSNLYGSANGGGIYIRDATVYIDPFTVAHTTNNTDISGQNSSTDNINGSYILRNC
jgi:hypothetical protein